MTDFETATIKSITEMLPNVLHNGTALLTKKSNLNSLFITGCLFHFEQAVRWQVRSKRLSTKYREDEYFRLNVTKLSAHGLVPVGDVIVAFDLVPEEYDDLLNYFEKTWISRWKRRGICVVIIEKVYML